jgi:hypothetical protein
LRTRKRAITIHHPTKIRPLAKTRGIWHQANDQQWPGDT